MKQPARRKGADRRANGKRHLSEAERNFIERLIEAAEIKHSISPNWDQTQVVELDDGGMGSLRFVSAVPHASLKKISELEFTDSDGTPVSVALLVDQAGALAEIDVFKADFSPLISWPDIRPN